MCPQGDLDWGVRSQHSQTYAFHWPAHMLGSTSIYLTVTHFVMEQVSWRKVDILEWDKTFCPIPALVQWPMLELSCLPSCCTFTFIQYNSKISLNTTLIIYWTVKQLHVMILYLKSGYRIFTFYTEHMTHKAGTRSIMDQEQDKMFAYKDKK